METVEKGEVKIVLPEKEDGAYRIVISDISRIYLYKNGLKTLALCINKILSDLETEPETQAGWAKINKEKEESLKEMGKEMGKKLFHASELHKVVDDTVTTEYVDNFETSVGYGDLRNQEDICGWCKGSKKTHNCPIGITELHTGEGECKCGCGEKEGSHHYEQGDNCKYCVKVKPETPKEEKRVVDCGVPEECYAREKGWLHVHSGEWVPPEEKTPNQEYIEKITQTPSERINEIAEEILSILEEVKEVRDLLNKIYKKADETKH